MVFRAKETEVHLALAQGLGLLGSCRVVLAGFGLSALFLHFLFFFSFFLGGGGSGVRRAFRVFGGKGGEGSGGFFPLLPSSTLVESGVAAENVHQNMPGLMAAFSSQPSTLNPKP